VEEFIERLTWRTNNEIASVDQLDDPDFLHETFIQTIKDLKILQERQQRKCDKLEDMVKEEMKVHSKNIGALQERHQVMSPFSHFSLDHNFIFNLRAPWSVSINWTKKSIRLQAR
jgi:exocyst complex component 5